MHNLILEPSLGYGMLRGVILDIVLKNVNGHSREAGHCIICLTNWETCTLNGGLCCQMEITLFHK